MSAHATSCCAPAKARLSVRNATKSAAKSGASSPMSSRPRFLAPPLTASFSVSRADNAATQLQVVSVASSYVGMGCSAIHDLKATESVFDSTTEIRHLFRNCNFYVAHICFCKFLFHKSEICFIIALF